MHAQNNFLKILKHVKAITISGDKWLQLHVIIG